MTKPKPTCGLSCHHQRQHNDVHIYHICKFTIRTESEARGQDPQPESTLAIPHCTPPVSPHEVCNPFQEYAYERAILSLSQSSGSDTDGVDVPTITILPSPLLELSEAREARERRESTEHTPSPEINETVHELALEDQWFGPFFFAFDRRFSSVDDLANALRWTTRHAVMLIKALARSLTLRLLLFVVLMVLPWTEWRLLASVCGLLVSILFLSVCVGVTLTGLILSVSLVLSSMVTTVVVMVSFALPVCLLLELGMVRCGLG